MLLFPSLFRWPQNVSALHSRRERRGGLLWRVAPSALRSGGTVVLLSSAFSLTPLHIGLCYAAARQMKHRDDQDSPWDRKPPDINGGGEATDTDIPEDEDPHREASFVVVSTGEVKRARSSGTKGLNAGQAELVKQQLLSMVPGGKVRERVSEQAEAVDVGALIKDVQRMKAQLLEHLMGIREQNQGERGDMEINLQGLRTKVERLQVVLQMKLSEVNYELELQAQPDRPADSNGLLQGGDQRKMELRIEDISAQLAEVAETGKELQRLVTKQIEELGTTVQIQQEQLQHLQDAASTAKDTMKEQEERAQVERVDQQGDASTSKISGMFTKVEMLQQQQKYQREAMQKLVNKQAQATKDLRQALVVALQAEAQGQRQQLPTSPTTSTSPREVRFRIPSPTTPAQIVAFLDDWNNPEPPAQLWVQVLSIPEKNTKHRSYAIKFAAPKQGSPTTVWPWKKQLQLLNDEEIFVTLCRYSYFFEWHTAGGRYRVIDGIGVPSKHTADFQEQIRGGKTSDQPLRHVRVGAFTQRGGSAPLFSGASGAAVAAIEKLLEEPGDGYEFEVVCETETKEWPFGSKPYEEYSVIHVKFQREEV
ncbi:unnamed protein product [Amoebophrya sp. A25]|nr:unnamed protein product [Amoebophrya sp. A25]|eukprot:GSA25T00019299001.1